MRDLHYNSKALVAIITPSREEMYKVFNSLGKDFDYNFKAPSYIFKEDTCLICEHRSIDVYCPTGRYARYGSIKNLKKWADPYIMTFEEYMDFLDSSITSLLKTLDELEAGYENS